MRRRESISRRALRQSGKAVSCVRNIRTVHSVPEEIGYPKVLRLLKPGGLLLLSDVCFKPLRPQAEAAGFRVLWEEDMTPVWKEYYIEAIWRGDPLCCEFSQKKCAYSALVCRKDETNGPV